MKTLSFSDKVHLASINMLDNYLEFTEPENNFDGHYCEAINSIPIFRNSVVDEDRSRHCTVVEKHADRKTLLDSMSIKKMHEKHEKERIEKLDLMDDPSLDWTKKVCDKFELGDITAFDDH